MPMQTGIKKVQWRVCDRCGLMYPLSQLARQQGLILCNKTCMDNLDNQYRPKLIAEALAVGDEGLDENAERFKDPGEQVVF